MARPTLASSADEALSQKSVDACALLCVANYQVAHPRRRTEAKLVGNQVLLKLFWDLRSKRRTYVDARSAYRTDRHRPQRQSRRLRSTEHTSNISFLPKPSAVIAWENLRQFTINGGALKLFSSSF
jgi:hypothetical protein